MRDERQELMMLKAGLNEIITTQIILKLKTV